MKSLSILLIATLLVAAAARPAVAEVQCNKVVQSLIPCIPYLTAIGGGAKPSAGCCDGVRNLKKMAQSSPDDKRATCECVKQAAGKYSQAIKPEVAAQLPKLCAVEISVPISKDTDCSKLSARGRLVENAGA
ncbi:unnamed protein product [Linum trigynum]|uniref:Non-specific lipid-transfer protein n=1 Tax=Linum trigynum TaxID=586398 RepID=A0AAV2EDI2_9ROSI